MSESPDKENKTPSDMEMLAAEICVRMKSNMDEMSRLRPTASKIPCLITAVAVELAELTAALRDEINARLGAPVEKPKTMEKN